MRVQIIKVEGTPEELAKAGVLSNIVGTKASSVEEQNGKVTTLLPPEVQDLLDKDAPKGKYGDIMGQFVAELLSWGDVQVRRGPSKGTKDGLTPYVRFHRHGSKWGAFVYLTPRSLTAIFRLPASAADGMGHVQKRSVKPDDAYKLTIKLTSEEAKSEALTLARKAHEDALHGK